MRISGDELFTYLKALTGQITSFDKRVTDQQNSTMRVERAIEKLSDSVQELKGVCSRPTRCYVVLDEDGNPDGVYTSRYDIPPDKFNVKETVLY